MGGEAILGKYMATKAIILAAGKGDRLFPITMETPKPLLEVNGEKLIESLIRGMIKQGICEIFVITGYKKEQFAYLQQIYTQVKLVYNPFFETCNNISSLYVAREYLGDCIIADGDQLLKNVQIVNPRFDSSGYCSAWVEETSEWLQQVDEGGFVLSCSKYGGKKGWQLFSLSFWTRFDGEKLKRHVEELFEKEKLTNIFWDDIPMFYRKGEYRLKIREISHGDIVEIDTIQDLIEIEGNYDDRC